MKVKDGKEKGATENTIVVGCYDPQRLRELAEADKDGRVKIFPPSAPPCWRWQGTRCGRADTSAEKCGKGRKRKTRPSRKPKS